MDAATAQILLDKMEDGTHRIHGLLVAAPVPVIKLAVSGCGRLPELTGFELVEVGDSVGRALVGDESDGYAAVCELRRRLDALSVATALEWVAVDTAAGVGLRSPAIGALQPAPAAPAAPVPAGVEAEPEKPSHGGSLSSTTAASVGSAAPVASPHQPPPEAVEEAEAEGSEVPVTAKAIVTAQPLAPPMGPLAAGLVAALEDGETFLAEGWGSFKPLKKGTVGLWRKTVPGFALDAVKVRGSVPNVRCEDLLHLMQNGEVKTELSKSTPSPIKVMEVVDGPEGINAHAAGGRLHAELIYQENKFPWPLANRHACFATAAAALPALPDGQAEEEGLECGGLRWLLVEASTPHEAVARLGSSSSLVEWEFVNTILLEQATDRVVISVSSRFDIKGDIPIYVMDKMMDDFGAIFADWTKLLQRKPLIDKALAVPRRRNPTLRPSAPLRPEEQQKEEAASAESAAVAAAAGSAAMPTDTVGPHQSTPTKRAGEEVRGDEEPVTAAQLWGAVSARLEEEAATQMIVVAAGSQDGQLGVLVGQLRRGRRDGSIRAPESDLLYERFELPQHEGCIIVWNYGHRLALEAADAEAGNALPHAAEVEAFVDLLGRPQIVALLAFNGMHTQGKVLQSARATADGPAERRRRGTALFAAQARPDVLVAIIGNAAILCGPAPEPPRSPPNPRLLRAMASARLLSHGLGLHVALGSDAEGDVSIEVEGKLHGHLHVDSLQQWGSGPSDIVRGGIC